MVGGCVRKASMIPTTTKIFATISSSCLLNGDRPFTKKEAPMTKLAILASIILSFTAAKAHADCFSDCESECLDDGHSSKSTCTPECTAECGGKPKDPGGSPVCTPTDNSAARNECIAGDYAWYAACSVDVGPFSFVCETIYDQMIDQCPPAEICQQ